MKRSLTVQFWKDQKTHPWVISWRQGSKRRTKTFKLADKKSADAFAREKFIELDKHGKSHETWSIDERRVVLLAREKSINLRDALEYYEKHRVALNTSALVEIALDEFLSIKDAEGKSAAHFNDLRLRLGKFVQSFQGRHVASIITQDLDRWFLGLLCGAQSRKNYRRALHNFFGFCVGRSYCQANPVVQAAKFKVPPHEIGVLTVRQSQALLDSAGKITPALAIGMFAGLRREEIARLDWSEVNLETRLIEVKAGKAKTGQRRNVEISENLREWLAPFRAISGPVRPANYKKLAEKAVALAGIADWPNNALRHSFASYHLEAFRDAAKTSLELGHKESGTLFDHYRQLVKSEDAIAFWQILPRDCTKILNFEAA